MDSKTYKIDNIERICSKQFDAKKLNRDIGWKLKIAELQRKLSAKLKDYQQVLSSCPICNSADFSLFVNIYDFQYCECDNCGHIFCKTPPNSDSIKALYENDRNLPKSAQCEVYLDQNIFESRVENISFPKVKFVSDRSKTKGKWIDIGCGTGELIYAAQKLGWDATGIESDPDEVSMAKKNGLNVKNVFLNENNIAENIEDGNVISLINILEHIARPSEFLQSVARLLKKDTIVLIEVPHHPSISSFANLAFPSQAHRHIYPPDHLHIFTEKSLSIILDNSHLNPISLWSFGQDIAEIFSSIAVVSNFPNTKLYDCALKTVDELQAVLDKNGLSDTMLLIAKKI